MREHINALFKRVGAMYPRFDFAIKFDHVQAVWYLRVTKVTKGFPIDSFINLTKIIDEHSRDNYAFDSVVFEKIDKAIESIEREEGREEESQMTEKQPEIKGETND
jgi:hypothetical protein